MTTNQGDNNGVAKEEEVVPIVVPSYSESSEKKKDSLLHKQIGKLKKWKNQRDEKQAIKKKETVLSQTPDILPFLEINEEYIQLKDGVMDILQIRPKDLFSLNDDDLHYALLSEGRFLRSYSGSFKEVAMNFPSNTEQQRQYWLKKKEATTDPIRLKFIERKLFEFDFLEKERTNREFFIFIYAENPSQLEEEKKLVIRSKQQSFPITELSIDKKMDVLFILNNQNSKL